MPTHLNSRPRVRFGRLLLECLVVTALLGATALLSVSLAQSSARSLQLAQATTAGWARATTVLEQLASTHCVPSAGSGTVIAPGMILTWSEQLDASVRAWRLDIELQHSALAQLEPTRLDEQAAWFCP